MWNLHEMVARSRATNLLREAQHDRFLRSVWRARRGMYGLYDSAMVWLGRWLIARGWRLRARHGAIEL
jgi:hypothetical protein